MVLRQALRSPVVFWVGVGILSAITGSTVSNGLSQARAAAARYGSVRPAVVALRGLEAGERLSAGDVTVRRTPRAFLPPGTFASPSPALGRVVVVPLFPGEPVLQGHLAPPGQQGLAALLPGGRHAIAVPADDDGLRLRRGDLVEVLATFEPAPVGSDPTFSVAEAAMVLEVGPEAVTVAVAPEEARRVAYALAKGAVTLAVSGTRSPAG